MVYTQKYSEGRYDVLNLSQRSKVSSLEPFNNPSSEPLQGLPTLVSSRQDFLSLAPEVSLMPNIHKVNNIPRTKEYENDEKAMHSLIAK